MDRCVRLVTRPVLAMLILLGSASPEREIPARTQAVGLDVRIADGRGSPMTVVPGGRYYVAALDLAATIDEAVDRDVSGLVEESFLRDLDWSGLHLLREEWIPDASAWRRVRVHTDAAWMAARHTFTLTVVDGSGSPLGSPVVLDAGSGRERSPHDVFAIRRASAIQTASGCGTEGDCTGGTFREEGLFQLRNATPLRSSSFVLDERAAALSIVWNALPGRVFETPLAFEPHPAYAYGLEIRAEPVGSVIDGRASPGDSVSFRLRFTDGQGNPLFAPGRLPSYRDFLEGRSAGLRYFAFEQGVLFFKDKNREGVLLGAFGGPIERVRQNRSEVPFEDFLNHTTVVALPERDGYFCEWQLVPPGDVLFGGAVLDSARWDEPVSDVMTFRLPANAEAGTYLFTVKARREYLGESVLATAEAEIKVGATGPAMAPWVGGCERCHVGDLSLARVLHGNDDTRSCDLCHAPLGFEPDNLLTYRAHYVHFFSQRFDQPKDSCRVCHEAPESVRRPSNLACLSCHLRYHGGAEESGLYGQCADVYWCHPDHNLPLSQARSGALGYRSDERPAASASIPYRLSRTTHVRITIFDVAGREVDRIEEGLSTSPGDHVARWDGWTAGGGPAPNGVYYARIEAGTDVQRTRVLLLR